MIAITFVMSKSIINFAENENVDTGENDWLLFNRLNKYSQFLSCLGRFFKLISIHNAMIFSE